MSIVSTRRRRWLDIFRRRAKTTGELPSYETRRELRIDASDDSAKVDNSNPSEEFALNLEVELDRLFSLETADEVLSYVTAKDDFGGAIESMPLSETSSRVWFDFCSAGPAHDYGNEEISVARFVTDTCYVLKDEMIPNRERFDYLHLGDVDGLVLKRVTWDRDLNAWYFQFV